MPESFAFGHYQNYIFSGKIEALMKLFKEKNKLKILFVGTEAAPFAKVGGLASVMYALPKSLQKLGHDVRVMIPRYLPIDTVENNLEMVLEHLEVPTQNEKGEKFLICNVKKFTPKKSEDSVVTYFLENQEYYEQRANVYGYGDDPVRWALFSRGVLEFLRNNEDWSPDVIAASDWQMGYLLNYLKDNYKEDPVLSKIATVFCIHNMHYQGMFDQNFVQEMDYDDGHGPLPSFEDPRLSKINAMRRGIICADSIVTVSDSYSKEILTKEYGELLDDLLRERRDVLYGILNGIDYDVWNPTSDPFIKNNFDESTLDVRQKNKKILQERFGLKVDDGAFLISIVSRLNKQKGFQLLPPIIETLLQEIPIQLLIIGEGDTELMTFFKELEAGNPGRVATHLRYDPSLPHLVFAGSDSVLIPSKFEPSGLTQMEAMRMGTVPIVRKTGGLADSVEDFDPNTHKGTGFVFEKFNSSSLMISLIRAFENFRSKKTWREIQKRAMQKDFSWDSSAKKYCELFTKTLERHNKLIKKLKS